MVTLCLFDTGYGLLPCVKLLLGTWLLDYFLETSLGERHHCDTARFARIRRLRHRVLHLNPLLLSDSYVLECAEV